MTGIAGYRCLIMCVDLFLKKNNYLLDVQLLTIRNIIQFHYMVNIFINKHLMHCTGKSITELD